MKREKGKKNKFGQIENSDLSYFPKLNLVNLRKKVKEKRFGIRKSCLL